MADNSLVVNIGTALTMADDDISGVHYPRVKIGLGADGAAADWTGNIPSGTITALAKGTVSTGTVDVISQFPPNNFGTVVFSGTTTLGTIKAAVAGSQIFVTDMTISAGSASNVEIGSGGTSTLIAGTFFLNANGGVAENYTVPISTVAGSALVYKQSVNGPLSINVQGFVR